MKCCNFRACRAGTAAMVGLVSVFGAIAASVGVSAAEVQLRPGASVRMTVAENRNLRRSGARTTVATVGRAWVEWRVRDETTEFSLRPEVIGQFVTNDRASDGTRNGDGLDARLLGNFVQRGERFEVGLPFEARLDTTDSVGFVLADNTSVIGLVRDDVRRLRLNFAPRFDYRLTERTSATLFGNYTRVSFGDSAGAGSSTSDDFRDFDFFVTGATLGHALTERDLIGLTLAVSDLKQAAGVGADSTAVSANWTHTLSEAFTLSTRLGVETTRLTFLDDSVGLRRESVQGVIGALSLDYQGERVTARIGFDRSRSPTSVGVLTENDRYSGQLDYRLSRRARLRASASFNDRDSVNRGERAAEDVDQVRAELSAAYNVSEKVQIRGGVQRRVNSRSGSSGGTATDNRVFFSVRFNGDPIDIGG